MTAAISRPKRQRGRRARSVSDWRARHARDRKRASLRRPTHAGSGFPCSEPRRLGSRPSRAFQFLQSLTLLARLPRWRFGLEIAAARRRFSLREKSDFTLNGPVFRGAKANLFAERKATMLTPGLIRSEGSWPEPMTGAGRETLASQRNENRCRRGGGVMATWSSWPKSRSSATRGQAFLHVRRRRPPRAEPRDTDQPPVRADEPPLAPVPAVRPHPLGLAGSRG